MAKKSARDRLSNEVSAGSMADIAFLLLIFFLVTTTIDVDKGILIKLPPWSEEEPDIQKLKDRNVFAVLVNAQNQLLVRNEEAQIKELRERVKEFIVNPQRREDLSEKPTKAIIMLKNDRGTAYETYLKVYNELRAAYNELWDEEAEKLYPGDFEKAERKFEDMPFAYRKAIRDKIPLVISEAEPTAFGEEGAQ
ncbi:MAG: biopolymer transporter ExbD [Bacteroidetes bacterium]|jgi:biopolymer transport protein ExbD|nr:biopolymer transporter ExbD [Bacteroidota bacterium]MDF1865854.1 biopolymer transporter ExbD [Saprospiraceae bacterium]